MEKAWFFEDIFEEFNYLLKHDIVDLYVLRGVTVKF